jgi:hypothetical protein
MDGTLHLLVTQHPRKTVVLELWAGDLNESKLEVLGYLSDDMRMLVSYEWVINFPIDCYVTQRD